MNHEDDPTENRRALAGTADKSSVDLRAAGWFKSNLVALGSAAVLTVYAAGYMKTRAAAQRFAQEDLARQRPVSSMVASISLAAEPPRTSDAAARQPTSPPQDDKEPAAADRPNTSASREPVVASNVVRTNIASSPASPVVAANKPPPVQQDSSPTKVQEKTANAGAAAPAKSSDSSAAKTQSADSAAQAEKPKSQWKDGIYKGYGTSRHGDIEAEVEIKGGRIVFAYISQCLTQYPCSVFDFVVPQVISRQSPEVDFVSGATQSVNAFYYAVVQALSKAK